MAKDAKSEDPEYRARSTALRLLARREHSRQELRLKLLQRKLEASVIDPVLDEYEQEGWLDDARFADVYARQRMDIGYGPVRILAELQQRGVHKAPEWFDAVDDRSWAAEAAALRERRFGPVPEDFSEKMKQAQFLARRGFSSAQVSRALSITAWEE
ncbi:MAG: recombinase RecX [Marinobacter sp. 34-60-7]|nr:MAG: recombinase RecX [Marinobacter sp. 34-60-7]